MKAKECQCCTQASGMSSCVQVNAACLMNLCLVFFRELELLIALPFANIILEAVLMQADGKCLVWQSHCNWRITSLVIVDYSLLPP